MAKHKITVMWWTSASVLRNYLSIAGRYQISSICYQPNSAVNTTEFEMNWIDEEPEELGFLCPSYRVPNNSGTRLNPVDAYSADGTLYALDIEHIYERQIRGVYSDPTSPYIGLWPGDARKYEDFFGILIATSNSSNYVNGNNGLQTLLYRKDNKSVQHFRTYYDSNSRRMYQEVATSFSISEDEFRMIKPEDATAWFWSNMQRFSRPSYSQTSYENWGNAHSSMPAFAGISNFSTLIHLTDGKHCWSQVARDAYNSIPSGYDGNGIALTSDLVGITKSAKDTLDSMKSIGNKSKMLKGVANTYLSFRYGWNLLQKDVRDLSQAMQRNVASRFTKCTGQSVQHLDDDTEFVDTYQVYYDKYGGILDSLSELDTLTNELDLQLDLGNLWDLTKYSFVLDWFLDVGSVLESMDSFYNVAYRYKVLAVGQSTKVTKRTTVNGYGGLITETAYRRRYSQSAIPPSPLPATHQPRSQSWIDGAALLVQRI